MDVCSGGYERRTPVRARRAKAESVTDGSSRGREAWTEQSREMKRQEAGASNSKANGLKSSGRGESHDCPMAGSVKQTLPGTISVDDSFGNSIPSKNK